MLWNELEKVIDRSFWIEIGSVGYVNCFDGVDKLAVFNGILPFFHCLFELSWFFLFSFRSFSTLSTCWTAWYQIPKLFHNEATNLPYHVIKLIAFSAIVKRLVCRQEIFRVNETKNFSLSQLAKCEKKKRKILPKFFLC